MLPAFELLLLTLGKCSFIATRCLGLLVLFIFEVIWQVLLCHPAVGVIVRQLVALAVSQLFGPAIVCIAQIIRNLASLSTFDIG